ncbi:hypothetical protein M404DRAFT_994360 [Pisolithus tinctorius Marx 270]|uniref:Uncharacterized protein n=1 Tax=Pisolithus tinctorius Marx 270 TaxID=870435 RepID=A0A0C3PSJ6_PISTI|nr:hypothetical protein M404DRAFT_994360 [Pisolithus tinctorius Marx 270]
MIHAYVPGFGQAVHRSAITLISRYVVTFSPEVVASLLERPPSSLGSATLRLLPENHALDSQTMIGALVRRCRPRLC